MWLWASSSLFAPSASRTRDAATAPMYPFQAFYILPMQRQVVTACLWEAADSGVGWDSTSSSGQSHQNR